MTTQQRKILRTLYWFTVVDGVVPSVREIAAHLRLPLSGQLSEDLATLVRDGYLTRTPTLARTWQVTPKGHTEAAVVRVDPTVLGGLRVLAGCAKLSACAALPPLLSGVKLCSRTDARSASYSASRPSTVVSSSLPTRTTTWSGA